MHNKSSISDVSVSSPANGKDHPDLGSLGATPERVEKPAGPRIKRGRPGRVLMLVENSSYPGDVRVRREALTLAGAGYRVTVIAPANPGQPSEETIAGVKVYRYPAPPPGDGLLGYLREYGVCMAASLAISVKVLFREGFDVIHAANPPDTFALLAALFKPFGKKFVFDHHDLAPEMYYARFGGHGNQWVYRVLVALEKLSCRVADRVIATNQSYKQVEIERGKLPPDRITVVRNGPELGRLNRWQSVCPDEDLRRKAGTIIAFGGVMGYQDGVDYLLRALKHLLVDLGRSDFYCVLLGGKGDARAGLKALATELGLDDHVHFTGWVSEEDWVKYLSTADICADPDPSNPFTDRSSMIKMTEYMAAGKPIVAFDLPEHRFTAGDAALYVRPNDELEFARGIALLMDDADRRKAMGELGRQRIHAEFAWEYSAEKLLGAYRALLGGEEVNQLSR